MPEDAVLVFPTINAAEPDAYDKPFPKEKKTRKNVTSIFGEGDNLVSVDSTVTVDGEEGDKPDFKFTEFDRNTGYRRESPKGGFKYIIPKNTWVIDPDTGQTVPPQKVKPAVADGYWFAYDTKSLLSGEDHTVNFTGDYADGAFTLNVTYNILNPIEGTYRRDKLYGTEFNDYIRGKTGKDSLTGLGGDDLILGGWGRDTIDGGSGNDELWGDFGKDTFIFKAGYGQDTIFDFARKEVVEIE